MISMNKYVMIAYEMSKYKNGHFLQKKVEIITLQ